MTDKSPESNNDMSKNQPNGPAGFEASFSTLILSLASSAAMAMGLAPDPQSGKTEKDMQLARFNIDLLSMLSEKTKNNRTPDEDRFLASILQDLKMKFIQG